MLRTEWSEPEIWAWSEISAGRPADFVEKLGPLDPCKPEGWGDQRSLRAAFVKQLCTEVAADGATKAVQIAGACFPETVDLAHSRLSPVIRLESCRFEQPVNFMQVRIDDL